MGDLRYRGTVLVVEDSDDVVETVQEALRLRGYRTLVARDGLKALTMLASRPVDVIVLDLSMPIMTGWEFLDARAADPWLAAIPVVVLSGTPTVDPRWAEQVAKPFAMDDLVAAIERARRPPARGDTPNHLGRR